MLESKLESVLEFVKPICAVHYEVNSSLIEVWEKIVEWRRDRSGIQEWK